MHIERLYLENFRNYLKQEIFFNENINLLYGDNAQGKTNLIEAIYVCAMGKSFKYAFDREIINFDASYSKLEINFKSNGNTNNHQIIINKEEKKQIKCNSQVIKSRAELIGKLNVILFTPHDLNLIKEGPVQRRRFLDFSISQLRPKYLYALYNYNKVLEQKTKLLKSNNNADETLNVWNERLSEFASIIFWYRKSFLERLQNSIIPVHNEITKGKENIVLEYIKSIKFGEGISIPQIKETVFDYLEKNKNEELSEKSCLFGPHRDDISFYINNKNAKKYASQGQQRTAVLSLKLAEQEIFKEEMGEYPILLLDDITSELDSKRREYLFGKLENRQVFITCTDRDMVNISNVSRYRVVEGNIKKE